MHMKNKAALVPGQSIALAFAREGAKVAIAGVQEAVRCTT